VNFQAFLELMLETRLQSPGIGRKTWQIKKRKNEKNQEIKISVDTAEIHMCCTGVEQK